MFWLILRNKPHSGELFEEKKTIVGKSRITAAYRSKKLKNSIQCLCCNDMNIIRFNRSPLRGYNLTSCFAQQIDLRAAACLNLVYNFIGT